MAVAAAVALAVCGGGGGGGGGLATKSSFFASRLNSFLVIAVAKLCRLSLAHTLARAPIHPQLVLVLCYIKDMVIHVKRAELRHGAPHKKPEATTGSQKQPSKNNDHKGAKPGPSKTKHD